MSCLPALCNYWSSQMDKLINSVKLPYHRGICSYDYRNKRRKITLTGKAISAWDVSFKYQQFSSSQEVMNCLFLFEILVVLFKTFRLLLGGYLLNIIS